MSTSVVSKHKEEGVLQTENRFLNQESFYNKASQNQDDTFQTDDVSKYCIPSDSAPVPMGHLTKARKGGTLGPSAAPLF